MNYADMSIEDLEIEAKKHGIDTNNLDTDQSLIGRFNTGVDTFVGRAAETIGEKLTDKNFNPYEGIPGIGSATSLLSLAGYDTKNPFYSPIQGYKLKSEGKKLQQKGQNTDDEYHAIHGDNSWNVSGGVGEVSPYLIAGALTKSKGVGDAIIKDFLISAPLTALEYGHGKDAGENIAKNVLFNAAATGIGEGAMKLLGAGYKATKGKTIPPLSSTIEKSITITSSPADDISIAKEINKKITPTEAIAKEVEKLDTFTPTPKIQNIINTAKQNNNTKGISNRAINIESGGNYNAVNKKSGAFGKYQFMPSTLKEYANKAGLTIDQAKTPQGQEAIYKIFSADQNKGLIKKGIEPNEFNTYMAHQQGVSGWDRILKGNIDSTLTKNMLSNTPAKARLTGNVRTDFLNFWSKKFKDTSTIDAPTPHIADDVVDAVDDTIAPQTPQAKSALDDLTEIVKKTDEATQTPKVKSALDELENTIAKADESIVTKGVQVKEAANDIPQTPSAKLYNDIKTARGDAEARANMELLQARAKAAGEDLDTFIGNNPVDINPNIVDDIAPPYSHIEKVGKGYDQMTFDELKSHPRYQELVDMRRDVSSTQENKVTNESKASGYYDNTGTYVPNRIKLNDTNRNFASDFELTKADIRAIESGKLTPQIHSKLANDLGRLDYDPNWRSVAQRSADGKIKKGMIEFGIKTDDEIKAVITLFRDADVTTLPHELAHFFRRTMSEQEDKVAREAFGVKGETWDKAAEERFANGFVKYLSYGEAPHPLVAGVFDKFKNWIKDVWVQVNRFNTTPNGTKITDLGMAHQLTPQQKQFYDALLGDRDAAQKLFGKVDVTPPVSRSELVSEPHEADKLFHAWGSSDKDIDKLLGIPQELTSFGRNFAQFKGNPKEAIAHLMKVKNGQVRGALYHNEIGEIDIVWGKVIDPKEHTGYGLAHIIDKHGEDIARRLDDITMGGKVIAKDGNKVILKNNQYEGVVKLDWAGKDKKWVLTAFDDTAPHQTIPDDVAKVSKSDNLLDRLDTTIPPKDLKTDKLSKQQWEANLAEWHKDSHPLTKNADGTPKVFYHGTKGDFNEFTPTSNVANGTVNGKGFYFTSRADTAGTYARGGGNIMPVYLNAKNPFTGIDNLTSKQKEYYLHTPKEQDEILKDLGFDSKATRDNEIVVFEPNQIKSIHNKGTFDESNPNILFQAINKETKEVDIEAFNKFAEPLSKSDNVLEFVKDFAMPIKTPIGEFKVDTDYMLNKAMERDGGLRINQIGYIKPTLERPAYIIEVEGKFHFIKPFIDETDKVRKFLSVISDRDGNVNMVTSTILRDKDIRRIVKNGNIIEDFVSKVEDGTHTSDGMSVKEPELKSDTHGTTIPPKDLKTDKTDTLHQEQTIENDIHTVAPKATWWLPKILNTIKQSDGWATVSKHRLNSVVGYESLKEQTFRDIQTQLTNIEELHHGLKEFSEETRVAIHRYMTGQKVELHPELKLLADNFRKQINDMGQELVDSGVLAKETFDDWKKVYLHRSYAKHLNKESAKRAFKEGGTLDTVYERGKSLRFKADEIPEIKEDLYANGYKADDIDNANTIDELIALANTKGIAEGGTKITKLPNGKLKLRRDYTFDERLAMGEVEDIAYTLPQTMASLQVMVNNAKFLDSLPNSVIANAKEFTPEVLETSGFKLASGKKYGALNGKWVHKDVLRDINKFQRGFFGEDNGFAKIGAKLLTYFKKTHTVYNPGTHFNNLMANIPMSYMGGLDPVEMVRIFDIGIRTATKINRVTELKGKLSVRPNDAKLRAELTSLESPNVKLWYALQSKGLFGRSGLNDTLGKYYKSSTIEPKEQSKLVNGLKWIDEKASTLYASEDDIYRFALAKHYVEKNKLSIDDAITKVNQNLPDYTKTMPPVQDFLRRTGIVPFMSWTYHSTPILLRQMKEHPIKAAVAFALTTTPYMMFDIDPFSARETPDAYAFKRIPIGKNGNKVQTLKIDKWNPHGDLLGWLPFTNKENVLVPENLRQMFTGSPYSALMGWATNHDPFYNRKISYADNAVDRNLDVNKYLAQSFLTPDIVDNLYDYVDSRVRAKKDRAKDKVVDPRTKGEAQLKMFGINLKTYNKDKLREEKENENVKKDEPEIKMSLFDFI